MTSDHDKQVSTTYPSTPGPLRLEMKDRNSGHGHVDGGWWPHSYNAAEEFPALIDALGTRVGRIERIGYDLDVWHSVRRKLIHGGDVVRCEGFHTVFADTINVVSITGLQIRLLVVPPQTDTDIAEAALHAASELASLRTVRDILAPVHAPVNSVRPAARAVPGRAIRAAQPR